MLSTTLPLIPFSATRLPKKEWTGNEQEKKGRPINLDAVHESIILHDKIKAGEIVQDEDDESESDEDSKDTRDYMSEDSWNSDEEFEDDEGVGLAAHIKELLPERAEVGKPQPKLIKPPPPPKKKSNAPGFFGRQWIAFQEWREKEKEKRKHYVYREFENKIKLYEEQVQKEIDIEIESIKKEVIKAAYQLQKRIRINSMAKKSKEGQVERYVKGVNKRDSEAKRMAFFCANLQRWAVEKHDHKIEMDQLKKAEELEKLEKQKIIDKKKAQNVSKNKAVVLLFLCVFCVSLVCMYHC
jgi:hypothetical protein